MRSPGLAHRHGLGTIGQRGVAATGCVPTIAPALTRASRRDPEQRVRIPGVGDPGDQARFVDHPMVAVPRVHAMVEVELHAARVR